MTLGFIRRRRCRRAPVVWSKRLPAFTHLSLYLLLISVPLAGYLNAAAAGHAVSFFGLLAIPPLIPENDRLSEIAIAVHLASQ
jgi:cytochrome b561